MPDSRFYQPQFMPWLGFGDFPAYVALARPYSLVSDDRLHVLLTLARHAAHLPGAFVECGVYKGGTAMLLAKAIAALQRPRELHLFDSFAGMPSADTMVDLHQGGDYADTSRAAVEARTTAVLAGTPHAVVVHEGWIPDTFAEARIDDIAFAHIDVDIHRSVADCCEYVYPRLVAGGVMVFDDYGFPTCPGARAAVDMFFRDRPERPLVLMTGQAVVHKLPDAR